MVDIEAIGSGSRVFDYATLLDHQRIEPAALELLVTAAAAVAGPGLLRACFDLVALDLVDYSTVGPEDHRVLRIRELTTRAQQIDHLTSP
ncbi:hypothetical protein DT076_13465 [Desertihabitans brevis]|uniref:Uncharacterized protein n=1 Tax=Desertihabitans brevis TaxID=2268447 RepID=A0A367YV75_9ACTN|nr:hypothetical protein [Desertihabitans brevis]RCK68922.1 hypothetical protein DT076_13465 [Desertihabitans brevis]